jgi:hypothetical protein
VAGAARARVDRGAGAAAIGLRLGVPARPARQERGEVIGERAHIVFGDAREVAHHRVHRAGGDRVLRFDAGAQVREELLAAPGQRRGIRRVQRGRRARAHRLARLEIGVQRADVLVGEPRVVLVGKRGIEMPALAVQALAQRAPERGLRPGSDPGFGLGGDVGAVDRAEGRLQRPAAGVGLAARRGMTAVAVAQRCKLRALAHQPRFERRRRRRLDRRERALRGTSRDAEQRRGAKSLYHLRKRPPPPKNSRK